MSKEVKQTGVGTDKLFLTLVAVPTILFILGLIVKGIK